MNEICGPDQSGKTTLLTAIAAACVASGKSPLLICQNEASADWFKRFRDPCGLLVANGLRVTSALRFSHFVRIGAAPDIILIDGARSCGSDIVNEVTEYLELRHRTTQVVVVR
jgi:ABC-type cobalamin/Fe3+-siderophores transport system ATPase subunit